MEATAKVVETHISTLFFYGDHVLKLRKPVRFGFLDFTSLDARREDCEREVVVNRRLAPDVYIGTANIALDTQVLDYAVVMRRLPEERNLEHMVRAGVPATGPVREVARALATFHAHASRPPQHVFGATAEAIWQRWLATAEELGPYIGDGVDLGSYQELTRLASRYLHGREALFQSRIAAGHIIDGHGDIQSADIFCLDDGPRILDALEFDDQLRLSDWLADLAFLVADLARLRATDLAEEFLTCYFDEAGMRPPQSLLDFYVAYRAHIRMLVECLRGPSGNTGTAGNLLRVGLDRLRRATVRMVLVGGPPGSGKSTLAAWLGRRMDAEVISSDLVRESVSPPRGDPHRYDGTERARVYLQILERAGELLRFGRSVVLDATWGTAGMRGRAADLARATAAEFYELRCTCPTPQREGRIAGRHVGGHGSSEATPALTAVLDASADPWPCSVTVDCSNSVEDAGNTALLALQPAPTGTNAGVGPTSKEWRDGQEEGPCSSESLSR